MTKKTKLLIIIFIVLISIIILISIGLINNNQNNNNFSITALFNLKDTKKKVKEEKKHPMEIKVLRSRDFPGGDFIIEKKLANKNNYKQFIVSYLSEGLKIYGLLTVPLSPKPVNGYPAIVFIHGYIPPKQYSTIKNYSTYQARLARAGFVTFKSDLRGHGNSEGEPASAHYSEKYTVDTMYAISYLKKYKDVDSTRIGYWGHSNGGEIGLRIVVITYDIKAASFWAGVVGSYKDMLETYNYKIRFLRNRYNPLVVEYGLPSTNPDFWNKIEPYVYLSDITIPIQIQHGTADKSVPIELSIHLRDELKKINRQVEYFEYKGDNHNISKNVDLAFKRTIEFYKKHL